MRGVDLFAGWGGFTVAAESVGIKVVHASNHWPLAVQAHALNHPNTEHSCQDLRQMDWTTLPPYEILIASPACQGHSTASQPKRRQYHDALRATALAVIDCADVTRPQAIVVENVPSFTNWELFGWWCEGLQRLGYTLDVRVLVASRFGVPQRRTRLFILATRNGVVVPQLAPSATEPAFGPMLQYAPPEVWRPVATATPRVQERVAKGRRLHGERFLTQHVTGHPGVPLHEPIRTITTAPNHWNLVDGDHYRPLTARELARGMGFPDTYVWPETAGFADVTKGLGNAVPPPLGAAVLSAVADAIADQRTVLAA